jgi:phospholipase C
LFSGGPGFRFVCDVSPRSLDAAREALKPIEHIVVLVLENRSFDHTLGYLALPGHELQSHDELPVDVRGLRLDFSNEHDGATYSPAPLDEDVFKDKRLDPPHDADSVAAQIAEGTMGGFVSAFAASLAEKQPEAANDQELLKAVMAYLTPQQVPVYDHLVRNFCICDSWHCSIPGPTMPNRFYAVTGTTRGILNNIDLIVGEFGKFKSFFRYLDASWRWYSSDPGILRAIDEQYMFDNDLDTFAYFDQQTEVQPRSFLRDVLGDSERDPDLPAVCWIDPNFAMGEMLPDIPFNFDGPGSNDDHPPSPVIAGQKLVNKIYTALGSSDYWKTTLFVVMYDEHGGFYDHVAPPDERGPRIPVLLVSPHVKRGVCHEPFDHASVIKTILLRFGTPQSLDQMPASVREANDLSIALRDDGPVVPFTPVPNAGAASIDAGDLNPALLPNNGSTLSRAIAFSDRELTDLQRDIIYGIAIPLRTGYKFLRRARERRLVRWMVGLFTRVRKRRRHLRARRP